MLSGAVFNEDMNSWVHYNDSSVSLKSSLLDIVDYQPYILFYKKITSKVFLIIFLFSYNTNYLIFFQMQKLFCQVPVQSELEWMRQLLRNSRKVALTII